MKIYRVTMSYFDGDHEHGRYESPFFLRREDAEAFRQALVRLPEGDPRRWWTDDGWSSAGPERACIDEIEVCEAWNGVLKPATEYLCVTYT